MIDEQTQYSVPPVRHRRARRPSVWRELPILLIVAVLVAVGVRAFVLQTFFIPSESMEHTLNINDRVLVNKLVYDFHSPRRGEVIVFTSPMSWRNSPDETDFIKRVIGVAGDRVVCCDVQNRLLVNGVPLDEPYLNHDEGNLAASPRKFSIVVPAGRLWVMGDNRFYSGDSEERYYVTANIGASTIATSAVIGRAFVKFWPLSRAGWLSVPPTFSHLGSPAAG